MDDPYKAPETDDNRSWWFRRPTPAQVVLLLVLASLGFRLLRWLSGK